MLRCARPAQAGSRLDPPPCLGCLLRTTKAKNITASRVWVDWLSSPHPWGEPAYCIRAPQLPCSHSQPKDQELHQAWRAPALPDPSPTPSQPHSSHPGGRRPTPQLLPGTGKLRHDVAFVPCSKSTGVQGAGPAHPKEIKNLPALHRPCRHPHPSPERRSGVSLDASNSHSSAHQLCLDVTKLVS